MKIIPALDILAGKVVRLFKGSFKQKKEYSDDPVSMAKYWQDQGAGYLHIVDLDGAKAGRPENAAIIKDKLEARLAPPDRSVEEQAA